jgi:hypothetical protein
VATNVDPSKVAPISSLQIASIGPGGMSVYAAGAECGWRGMRLARKASFLPISISSVREIESAAGSGRIPRVFPNSARRGDAWEMFEQVNMLEKLDQAEA